MLTGNMPIFVLKEGTNREQGKNAQKANIEAAKAIADAVRTTLGPKGMDKMLVDSIGDIIISNDGATILKEMDVDHPTAKMIVEVAKAQDSAVGDGTTTAVILAGEFLKQAEELLGQGVHPTVIANGYRLAVNEVKRNLDLIATTSPDDKILRQISETALAGKNIGLTSHTLSDLVVKAVNAVSEEKDGKIRVDTANIKVDKKSGGSVSDTQFISGLVIDKEKVHSKMPSVVKGAKVALIDCALEITVEDVRKSPMVSYPLTRLDVCAMSDGAAVAILANEEKAFELCDNPVLIKGIGTGTDTMRLADRPLGKVILLPNEKESDYKNLKYPGIHSFRAGRSAAKEAYESAGITDPLEELDLVELHDAYTSSEIQTYEDLGLCKYGEGGKFVEEGKADLKGKVAVNPSGGLLACGHPVGATGIMQAVFMFWQLQHSIKKHFKDDALQIGNAKRGLIHSHAGTGTYVTATVMEAVK